MNDTTTPAESAVTDITTLAPAERAVIALKSTATEAQLRELVATAATVTQVSDKAGRALAHSTGMSLKRARTTIEATGKAAREDAQAFSKAVIAEEKRLIGLIQPEETRVLALRDGFDAKEAAEKAERERIERERVQRHEANIATFTRYVQEATGANSETISRLLGGLETVQIGADWEEFAERAKLALEQTRETLRNMHAAAVAREAEAARLEAERQEQARIAAEQARAAAELEAQRRALAEQQAALERQQREVAEALERQQAELRAQQEALKAQRLKDEQDREDARRRALDLEEQSKQQHQIEMHPVEPGHVLVPILSDKDVSDANARAFVDRILGPEDAPEPLPGNVTVSVTIGDEVPPAIADALRKAMAPGLEAFRPAEFVPVTPAILASPPPADEPATVTLGEICRRFGFTMTAAFVADTLKVPHRATDKAAKLYSEQDVQRIGRAMIAHIAGVLDMQG